MMHFSRSYVLFILGICLAGLLACVPNFLSDASFKALPSALQHRIGLGLDLRGGAHLLMAMDADQLKKDWLAKLRDDARKSLREAKIGASVTVGGNAVQVRLVKPEEADTAIAGLKKLIQPLEMTRFSSGSDISISKGTEPGQIVIEPTEPGMIDRLAKAAGASIETIRKRIDPGGTTEPNIVR